MRASRNPGPASLSALLIASGLSATISFALAAPPAPSPQPQPAPAATQSTQTSTSNSNSNADAAASISVQWFISDDWFQPGAWPTEDGPTAWPQPFAPGRSPAMLPSTPHATSPTSPSQRTWFDSREEPTTQQMRGITAIAVASAHASSHSRGRTSSTLNSRDATNSQNQNSSSSNSRATARAEARVAIIGGVQPQRPSNGDDGGLRRAALTPERQQRLDALTQLSRPADWRSGVALLGQAYLDHPELLHTDLAADMPELDAPRLHDLLNRANIVASRNQRAAEWVAVSVLMLADGRRDPAQQVLAKIAPTDDAQRDRVEAFTQALRSIPVGPRK